VINRDTNQRVPITSGKMVVIKIYHWDEKEHLIYFKVYCSISQSSWLATGKNVFGFEWVFIQMYLVFQATKAGGPGERHLYTVTDFESGVPGLVTCLTCDVTNSRGGACGYNSFEFSKKNTYYTMSCNGPHVPQEYLYKTPNEKIATLVTNDFLSRALNNKHLPKISNLDVKIDNGR
jgi:hypothetical protein